MATHYAQKRELQKQRIIEQLRLEGTSKNHVVYLSKGKRAQTRLSSTLLSLKNLQQQGLCHIPEEVVPVNDCSHYKKKEKISCIKMKLHPVQHVPTVPCLLHVNRVLQSFLQLSSKLERNHCKKHTIEKSSFPGNSFIFPKN